MAKSAWLISQRKRQIGAARAGPGGAASRPARSRARNACLTGIPQNPAPEFVTPGAVDFTGPAAAPGVGNGGFPGRILPSPGRVLSVKTTARLPGSYRTPPVPQPRPVVFSWFTVLISNDGKSVNSFFSRASYFLRHPRSGGTL
jgi:hypothetical protein